MVQGKAWWIAQRELAAQKHDECRAKCEAENKMADIPEAARDAIWRLAWENGHSCGYDEVSQHYADYAVIAKEARK